jgi:hypothetical protein
MTEQAQRPEPRAGHVVAALRFLRRRLIVDVTLLVAGVLLLATGIIGFTYLGRQSDELAANGVTATATALTVDNYHHRFQLDEHVVVTFRTVGGVAVTASCYLGANDRYNVGQPVTIVYDPDQPNRIQLAGAPELGPAGAPFLGAVVLGLVLGLAGGYDLLRRRGSRAALRGQDRLMTAARFGRRTMTLRAANARQDDVLEDDVRQDDALHGVELRVRGRVRGFAADADVPVRVFGDADPRSVLLIVGPSAVVYARLPKEPADSAETRAVVK